MNLYDFSTIMLVIIILSLTVLTSIFLIMRWIYFDAKSRGTNPWPWMLITAFVSPNFLGLIMYILSRPKSDMSCEKCKHRITQEMSFCPACGAKIHDDTSSTLRKTTNKSLIWGIVLFIFSITFAIGMVIYFVTNTDSLTNSSKESFFKPVTSTFMTSTNMNNKWKCSFGSLSGSKQGRFKAKSEHPKLVYSSEIEGIITFYVYNKKDSIIEIISSNISGEVTNLTQGEKYKVVATTNGAAKGKFLFEMK